MLYDPHKWTPGKSKHARMCRECRVKESGLGKLHRRASGRKPQGNRSHTFIDDDGQPIEFNRREARQGIVAKSRWAGVNDPLPRKKKEVM